MNTKDQETFEKLVLYLTHQKEGIAFVEFDTRYRREQLISQLWERLEETPVKTGILDIEQELLKHPQRTPIDILEEHVNKNKSFRAWFILGLESYLSEGDRLEHFNFSREAWFRFKTIFIFWFPTGTTEAFRKRADDFFDWVQVFFDFSEVKIVDLIPKGAVKGGGQDNASSTRGQDFETQVAELFRLMGFKVEQNRMVAGSQIDIIASKAVGPFAPIRFIVECKAYTNFVGKETIQHFSSIINLARHFLDVDLRGVIVTNKGFTKKARKYAFEKGIECRTSDELRRSIIDFTPYLESMIHSYRKSSNTSFFIEPEVSFGESSTRVSALQFIEEWMKQSELQRLIVLGVPGSGKTMLARKLFFNLGQEYLEKGSPWIPVLLDAKTIASSGNVEVAILQHLHSYGVEGNSLKAFRYFLAHASVVFFFDGFEQLTSPAEIKTAIDNVRELSSLLTGNVKLILIMRNNLFQEWKRNLGIAVQEYTTDMPAFLNDPGGGYGLGTRPLPADLLVLREFNRTQINEYFHYRISDEKWSDFQTLSNRYPGFDTLAKTPLFLAMMSEAFQRLGGTGNVNSLTGGGLYQVITDSWLERDSQWSTLNRGQKEIFLEELARRMWETNRTSINETELEDVLIAHFDPEKLSRMHRDFVGYDIRTSSFFNVDAEENYFFIHSSFVDFFVAKSIVRPMLSSSENREKQIILHLSIRRLSKEILDFLTDLALRQGMDDDHWWKAAFSKILRYQFGYAQPEYNLNDWCRQNALLVYTAIYRKLNPGVLITFPANMILAKVKLDHLDLSNGKMDKANFYEADLSYCNLSRSELKNANLTNANLQYCDLSQANLSNANLEGANLEHAKLDGTFLVNAKLKGARYDSEELKKAITGSQRM